MEYKIPLFKLNYGQEEEDAILSTIRSTWISTGPKCKEFEGLFEEKLNVKHAISVSNCTSALHLAMVALNIGEGDEVLCPSLSFAATVNCIKYVGGTPVFCDIESNEKPTISTTEIEKKITTNTKAIIVMHFAGFPCEMDEIMGLAEKHNLKVVEDACHAPLSEHKGQKLGTIGDIGCFSFFSNKNISTGEGGMLVTNNTELNDRMKLLRSHGMTSMSYERSKGHSTSYDIVDLGYNYRMDDMRASLGIVQFNKLEADLVKRIEIRKKYVDRLSRINGITIPFAGNKEFVSNYVLTIVLKNSDYKRRDEVRNRIHDQGIQTSVHYPAIHRFSIYENDCVPLPNTEYFADNVITLPMYGSLSDHDINEVCDAVERALND
jgi:dTDP-4-amino-4,6-dideoxygalactose transaminase